MRGAADREWIRIRGVNASNPVLLLIQQGPGLPMINEVRRFEHLLGLEQDFTVIYWDQRGCGRSLRGSALRAAREAGPVVGRLSQLGPLSSPTSLGTSSASRCTPLK